MPSSIKFADESANTDPGIVDQLENFFQTTFSQGIIKISHTPISNRGQA